MNFEGGVLNPFNDYLKELPIKGISDSQKHLKYLNNLVENDTQRQTLEATKDSLPNYRYWTIKKTLTDLGIIQGNLFNYESLIKLLKQTKPKDRVIKDFIAVFKEIERNYYNVSSGLIADGIIFALNGATLETETYQQIVVLTVSAFAIMQNKGL